MIKNEKAFVLTVVIIVITALLFIGGAVMTLAYNNKIMLDRISGARTKAYYYANAGVVDAQWRLRTAQSASYATPTYDPPPYSLDVDGDGINDVTVDISAVIDSYPTATYGAGTRRIESTGRGA